jgi:hypothetical protein
MQTDLLVFQQFIIIVLLLCLIWTCYSRRLKKWWKGWRKQAKGRRQLRPRSPRDCAQCCLEHLRGPRMTRSPPPHWQDIKSPRGRPKENVTGTGRRLWQRVLPIIPGRYASSSCIRFTNGHSLPLQQVLDSWGGIMRRASCQAGRKWAIKRGK